MALNKKVILPFLLFFTFLFTHNDSFAKDCYLSVESSGPFSNQEIGQLSIPIIKRKIQSIKQIPTDGVSSNACLVKVNVLETVDGVSVVVMGKLSAIGISKQKNLNGVLQALFLGLGYMKEAEQLQLPEKHSNERFAWEQIKDSNDYRVIETFLLKYPKSQYYESALIKFKGILKKGEKQYEDYKKIKNKNSELALKLIESSYHNGNLLSYFVLGDSENNVNYYKEYLNELSRRKENELLYKYSNNIREDLEWYGIVIYREIISNYESFLWIEGAIKKTIEALNYLDTLSWERQEYIDALNSTYLDFYTNLGIYNEIVYFQKKIKTLDLALTWYNSCLKIDLNNKNCKERINQINKFNTNNHSDYYTTLGILLVRDLYVATKNGLQILYSAMKLGSVEAGNALCAFVNGGWGLDGEKDTVILGNHVISGKGRDYRAMQICLEASDIGSLEARAIIGRHYVFNDNKPRLAFKYLKGAADNGEMMAAQILGEVYKNGCCGFKEDWRESYKWFKKVADSGNRSSAYAMWEIGQLYERSKMYEYALVWYKKAADNDHSYAREDYEELLAEHPELDN